MTAAHGPGLIVVGHAATVRAVEWEPPTDPRDSGFVLLLDDAPDLEPDEYRDDLLAIECVGCAITRWPHLQSALAIARQHGAAAVDEHGDWQAA